MQAQERFNILLVDDDATVIRILSHILGNFVPLRFATSGRVALKLARESVPDLVLLDVEMPELNGFEVCKVFKSDTKLAHVPVIFITSHDSPQLETVGLELGAADFIGKPLHASLVLARVRTYQRLKSLSDTLRSVVKLDFLTGAVTQRQLEKALTQEWLRALRSAAPLAVLLAEIDGFATYQVEFGADAGDACLRGVADALRSVANRPTDLLGRCAGAKFMMLLPETHSQGANSVAQRAIDAVDALQIGPHITLSIGGGFRESSRPILGKAGPKSSAETTLISAVPGDLIATAERALQSARLAGGRQARLVDIDGHYDLPAASSGN